MRKEEEKRRKEEKKEEKRKRRKEREERKKRKREKGRKGKRRKELQGSVTRAWLPSPQQCRHMDKQHGHWTHDTAATAGAGGFPSLLLPGPATMQPGRRG